MAPHVYVWPPLGQGVELRWSLNMLSPHMSPWLVGTLLLTLGDRRMGSPLLPHQLLPSAPATLPGSPQTQNSEAFVHIESRTAVGTGNQGESSFPIFTFNISFVLHLRHQGFGGRSQGTPGSV